MCRMCRNISITVENNPLQNDISYTSLVHQALYALHSLLIRIHLKKCSIYSGPRFMTIYSGLCCRPYDVKCLHSMYDVSTNDGGFHVHNKSRGGSQKSPLYFTQNVILIVLELQTCKKNIHIYFIIH